MGGAGGAAPGSVHTPLAAAAAAAQPLPAPLLPRILRSKIFVSLLAGVFAGIVGITGFKGFIVYLLAHAALAGLLLLKAGLAPQRYFAAA